MLEQEAGGTFLQEALVPWQVHCRQQVWSSQACGHNSRPPDHHLKSLCYSCRCSWATAWKASVLPYGALGREPPLKICLARRPALGEEIKAFCYERQGRWDTHMESCSMEILKNDLDVILCNVFYGDLAWAGRLDKITQCGPFQHNPFCESVILWQASSSRLQASLENQIWYPG